MIKDVLTPLPKSVLVPLELTAAALQKDAAIPNVTFGLGRTALMFLNEEMEDIMEIS